VTFWLCPVLGVSFGTLTMVEEHSVMRTLTAYLQRFFLE